LGGPNVDADLHSPNTTMLDGQASPLPVHDWPCSRSSHDLRDIAPGPITL
jgi:hypothetical protein